ncbi:hypothetical protein GQ55_2G066700 [Panicum hallii var. hallii]|uniref:Uncharacterized protein n=1 Tax=Panicum hallii var. hallii TaxID=1504633 RepID=A0A2T7EM61_9POAL|nr:hypothetical protein GQ55_2G066700 [Panicum hallii var. hallii]
MPPAPPTPDTSHGACGGSILAATTEAAPCDAGRLQGVRRWSSPRSQGPQHVHVLHAFLDLHSATGCAHGILPCSFHWCSEGVRLSLTWAHVLNTVKWASCGFSSSRHCCSSSM